MDSPVDGLNSADIFNDSFVDADNIISIKCQTDPSEIIDDWANMIDHTVTITNDWPTTDALKGSHNMVVCKSMKKEKIDDKQKPTEYMDIDNTKFIDIDNANDLDILEKSSMIAKNLKFQFNKRYDEDIIKFAKWLILSLDWLRIATLELSNRTFQSKNDDHDTPSQSSKLTNPSMNNKKVHIISRNSYKFCEFGHTCRFNYDKDQTCYAQHFVYNLVYLDIMDILEYITNANVICGGAHDVSEIKTSINTITYVINHMSEELSQLKTTSPQFYADYENRLYGFRSVSDFKQRNKKAKMTASPPENTRRQTSRSNQKAGREFFNKNRMI
jgi:hypothetical protein